MHICIIRSIPIFTHFFDFSSYLTHMFHLQNTLHHDYNFLLFYFQSQKAASLKTAQHLSFIIYCSLWFCLMPSLSNFPMRHAWSWNGGPCMASHKSHTPDQSTIPSNAIGRSSQSAVFKIPASLLPITSPHFLNLCSSGLRMVWSWMGLVNVQTSEIVKQLDVMLNVTPMSLANHLAELSSKQLFWQHHCQSTAFKWC